MTSSALHQQRQLTAAAKTLEQYPPLERLTEGLTSLTTEQLVHLQSQITSVLLDRAQDPNIEPNTPPTTQPQEDTPPTTQPQEEKEEEQPTSATPKPQHQETRKQYELLAQQQRNKRRNKR